MLGWELPPHNSGGLGVACYHMAKALANTGVAIDFVVPYEAEHDSIDFMNIRAATRLTPLERYGLGAYDTNVAYKRLSEADAGELTDMRGVQKRYVQFVEHILEDETFDAIHAHDWLTMEAGIRAREIHNVPLIVHVHATEFDRAGRHEGNPLIHEIEYQGLMLADRIIAVSNATKNIIVQKYGIPADKIDVVHNAFDPASMDSSYEYDNSTYSYLETLRSEGYTIVTTITRFTAQKGLSHLMQAAARASQTYDKLAFLFAGDGEERDQLIQQAAELGIVDKVFFTGFIRGKKWRDAYSVGDIFVMSSISEPFGLTALEAAHHGNALILTNQSGVAEVLSNIYRYDFWDIDALADRIVAIASSPALKKSMKENVKKEYARISWHDVAEQCKLIYSTTKGALA
jgi:glycosyltransferase involved in cell wall biosynthesis